MANPEHLKILKQVGETVASMKEKSTKAKRKDQLYMDIEFWYETTDSRRKAENPRQPHYYDFSRDLLIADF